MPKVLKEFVDKDTKVIYIPDVEFEGTVKRTKELEKLGFLEADEKKQEKKPEDGE